MAGRRAGRAGVIAAATFSLLACEAPRQTSLPPGCAFPDAALPHEVDVPPAKRSSPEIFYRQFPGTFRRSDAERPRLRVRVRLVVDTDGRVADGCVVEAKTPETGAAALERIRRSWRYVPATRDGRPRVAVVDETIESPAEPTLAEILQSRKRDDEPWMFPAVRRALFASTNIEELERAATDPPDRSGDVRIDAYARLGELGTPEALDAVDRIERTFTRASVAARWVASVPGPSVSAGGAVRFTAWADRRYGDRDLVLSWKIGEGPWARPRLATVAPSFGNAVPFWDGETVVVRDTPVPCPPPSRCGQYLPGSGPLQRPAQSWRLDIAAIVRDSDGDGWTDLEEARFGLDPHARDSDGDGITDGADTCPLLPLPAAAPRDADHEILATAAFTILGLQGRPHLMLPVPDTPQVHLWGLAGPVIYGRPRFRLTPEADQYGGALFVFWEIVTQTADEATVRVDTATSGTGGEGHRVYLRRIGSRWRVVAVVPTWMS